MIPVISAKCCGFSRLQSLQYIISCLSGGIVIVLCISTGYVLLHCFSLCASRLFICSVAPSVVSILLLQSIVRSFSAKNGHPKIIELVCANTRNVAVYFLSNSVNVICTVLIIGVSSPLASLICSPVFG